MENPVVNLVRSFERVYIAVWPCSKGRAQERARRSEGPISCECLRLGSVPGQLGTKLPTPRVRNYFSKSNTGPRDAPVCRTASRPAAFPFASGIRRASECSERPTLRSRSTWVMLHGARQSKFHGSDGAHFYTRKRCRGFEAISRKAHLADQLPRLDDGPRGWHREGFNSRKDKNT